MKINFSVNLMWWALPFDVGYYKIFKMFTFRFLCFNFYLWKSSRKINNESKYGKI